MTCYQSIKVPRVINIKRAWGKKQGNMRTMFKTFDNERFCKTVKDKKQRFDDMSPLSNANERDYEPIYIGNEGVKHNTKFEEQMNELIKRKVLLERSRFSQSETCEHKTLKTHKYSQSILFSCIHTAEYMKE